MSEPSAPLKSLTSSETNISPPPGPVIISQHKERGDELVTEAETKLR